MLDLCFTQQVRAEFRVLSWFLISQIMKCFCEHYSQCDWVIYNQSLTLTITDRWRLFNENDSSWLEGWVQSISRIAGIVVAC